MYNPMAWLYSSSISYMGQPSQQNSFAKKGKFDKITFIVCNMIFLQLHSIHIGNHA